MSVSLACWTCREPFVGDRRHTPQRQLRKHLDKTGHKGLEWNKTVECHLAFVRLPSADEAGRDD